MLIFGTWSQYNNLNIYFFQDQKIPKPKRLQDWYKRMLDKGIIERIVLDYKDIYKQALEDNLQSPAELPYFEGDFWPNVLEENIRELESVSIISQLLKTSTLKSICRNYFFI